MYGPMVSSVKKMLWTVIYIHPSYAYICTWLLFDAWSLLMVGVTVWEILTFGARPYPDIKAMELLEAIYKGVRLEQPQTCSSDIYAVLLKCEQIIWVRNETFTIQLCNRLDNWL